MDLLTRNSTVHRTTLLPLKTQELLQKPKHNWYGGHNDEFQIKLNDFKSRLKLAGSFDIASLKKATLEIIHSPAKASNFVTNTKEKLNWFTTYSRQTINDKHTIKLLVMCYLFYQHLLSSSDKLFFDGDKNEDVIKLNNWLTNEIGSEQIVQAGSNCLQQLKAHIDGTVINLLPNPTQTQNTPMQHRINIEKIKNSIGAANSKIYLSKIRCRSLPALGNKVYYANLDGYCIGLSYYWALSMHAAINSNDSEGYKTQHLETLSMDRRQDVSGLSKEEILELYKFPNFVENNNEMPAGFIEKPTKYLNQFRQTFLCIQNIGATDSADPEAVTFGNGVLLAIALLKQNNLTQIYTRILDYYHVMFMVITATGRFNKIYLYDPNNIGHQHVSFYIESPKFNSYNLSTLRIFNLTFGKVIEEINNLTREIKPGSKQPYLYHLHTYDTINEGLIGGPYYTFRCHASHLEVKNKRNLTPLENCFQEENLAQLRLSTLNKLAKKSPPASDKKISTSSGELSDSLQKVKSVMPSSKSGENSWAMIVAIRTKNDELIDYLIKLGNYNSDILETIIGESLLEPPHLRDQILRNRSSKAGAYASPS